MRVDRGGSCFGPRDGMIGGLGGSKREGTTAAGELRKGGLCVSQAQKGDIRKVFRGINAMNRGVGVVWKDAGQFFGGNGYSQ